MSTPALLVSALAGLAATLAGASLGRRARVRVAVVLTGVSCVAAALAAGAVLRAGHPIVWHSARLIPLVGTDVALTALGAVFTLVCAAVGVAATIYWLGYAHHGLDSRSASAAMPLFVTSMLLVPAAGGVVTFLALWEVMALASLVLVMNDQARREETRSAAQWYAVMTHAGAGAITLALILLAAHAGGQTFVEVAAHARHLPGALRATAFLLALVGFGSKAGVVPFHVWLPKAHAEAPGPASALMSGAMVNLGVYGVILVGFRLLGGGPAWWWLIVIALGVASALYGAIYAATSSDLKRLLAYSTADNMGLVLTGVGASGLLAQSGHAATSAIVLVAALLLLVNHAAFKGALFLAAGSVQVSTGTRDLDRLGGLMRRMPVTGVIFLVGALSVAALPPLNGFVGEWLLFQGLLHSLPAANTAVVIAVLVGVGALALTSGLTVAAFVKATGIGFLGRARSPEAQGAAEVPPAMRVGAGLLGAACVALGLVPMLVIPALERAATDAGARSRAPVVPGWMDVHLAGLRGGLAPVWLALGLGVGVLVVAGLRGAWRRRAFPARRAVEPWGSGRQLQTARMQYTATSFAEPLQRVFDDVIRPARDLDVTHAVESRYYYERISYRTTNDDLVERTLYRPVIAAARSFGARAARLQNGSVHRYLAYGLGALVVILAVIR